MEGQIEQRDTRRLWQGLLTGFTDYRGRTPNTSLVDDLHSFYALFKASNNTAHGTVAEVTSISWDEHRFVTEDVTKAYLDEY